MRTFWLAVGLCVLAGAVVVGCGGSNEAAISEEEFARQGNALCVTSNKKAAGEVEKAFEHPEFADAKSEGEGIRAEVTQLVPILIDEAEAQHKGIADLGLPEGQEPEIEAVLAAYKAWIKKAEAAPLKIVIANDIYNKAREMAGKAGLVKCQQTPFQAI